MPIFSAAKERTSKWKVLRQFGHRGARQISACVGQSCRQESKRTSQQQQQQPTRHLSLFSVPGCTCVQGMRSLSSSFDVWELDCHLPRVLPKRRCRLFDAWAGGDAGMRGRARRCHIDRTSSPGSEPASAPLYLFPHSSVSSFSPFYSAFISCLSLLYLIILSSYTCSFYIHINFFSLFYNLLTYFSFHIVFSDSFSLLRGGHRLLPSDVRRRGTWLTQHYRLRRGFLARYTHCV